MTRHSLSDGRNLAQAERVSRIIKGRQQGVKADPRRLLRGAPKPVVASKLQHSNQWKVNGAAVSGGPDVESMNRMCPSSLSSGITSFDQEEVNL